MNEAWGELGVKEGGECATRRWFRWLDSPSKALGKNDGMLIPNPGQRRKYGTARVWGFDGLMGHFRRFIHQNGAGWRHFGEVLCQMGHRESGHAVSNFE